jgi:2-iminobutanoate/2-iminopropanoate deaminase
MMTEIQRINLDIDYVGRDVFSEMGFVHVVSAGDTIYISGIAPVRGDHAAELELVGPDSMEEQADYVLRVLDDSLRALGLGRQNLINWTIFTTDMPGLAECVARFKEWAGSHPPTSTWVGVTTLFLPKMKLEMSAIAVR